MTLARLSKDGKYLFVWCVGCGHTHRVGVGADAEGPIWKWNGNLDAPTIQPSVREFTHAHEMDGKQYPEVTRCHWIMTDGVYHYYDDSTEHTLRGKVPLGPIPAGYGLGGYGIDT